MNTEKAKQLEYSSLVIGSKHLPPAVYAARKSSNFANFKSYLRKNQVQSSKNSRNVKTRMRTRNQRPDIFLEGQHMVSFQPEFDIKMLEKIRSRMTLGSRLRGPPVENVLSQNIIEGFQHIAVSPIRWIRSTKDKIERYGSAKKATQTPLSKAGNWMKRIDRGLLTQKETSNNSQNREDEFKRKQLFYIQQRDLAGIKAQSFVVTEYPSMQVITGFYFRKVSEIASLTKIMTFFAILKLVETKGLSIDSQKISIDEHVPETSGTSAELYEGDLYTVRQLLYGLMLPSGNDAALALAKWAGEILRTDKSETASNSKIFVGFMNKLASQIGMRFSTFNNPHGLPHPQNGSTAQDMGILICKCLDFSLFRQVVKTKVFKCVIESSGVKREVVWENTNKLLRREGFSGVKTGVTTTAGPCLATFYECSGKSFVVVLLRTNKLSRRFKETRVLLSLVLKQLNSRVYSEEIKKLLKNDIELDSDNSEDEREFNFERNDAYEMERRVKILQNEL